MQDPLVAKVCVVLLASVMNIGLLAWINAEASEKFEWWPFRDDYGS